jgi:hypothetical protein
MRFQQDDNTFVDAYLDFGKNADRGTEREAYRILNSIRSAS